MKATTRLVGASLSTLALACNLDKAPLGPGRPAFEESVAPSAPLVLHVVVPQATDPAIDRFLDDHYAWLDTTARTNHKLFVFLPGTMVRAATPQRPAPGARQDRSEPPGIAYEDQEPREVARSASWARAPVGAHSGAVR